MFRFFNAKNNRKIAGIIVVVLVVSMILTTIISVLV